MKWHNTPVETVVCPNEKGDYQTADNPYPTCYGADNWDATINDCVFMKQYMDIKELVTNVHDETNESFVDTTHERDYFLSQCAVTDDMNRIS